MDTSISNLTKYEQELLELQEYFTKRLNEIRLKYCDGNKNALTPMIGYDNQYEISFCIDVSYIREESKSEVTPMLLAGGEVLVHSNKKKEYENNSEKD